MQQLRQACLPETLQHHGTALGQHYGEHGHQVSRALEPSSAKGRPLQAASGVTLSVTPEVILGKVCRACQQAQPLTAFESRGKTKRRSICKQCWKAGAVAVEASTPAIEAVKQAMARETRKRVRPGQSEPRRITCPRCEQQFEAAHGNVRSCEPCRQVARLHRAAPGERHREWWIQRGAELADRKTRHRQAKPAPCCSLCAAPLSSRNSATKLCRECLYVDRNCEDCGQAYIGEREHPNRKCRGCYEKAHHQRQIQRERGKRIIKKARGIVLALLAPVRKCERCSACLRSTDRKYCPGCREHHLSAIKSQKRAAHLKAVKEAARLRDEAKLQLPPGRQLNDEGYVWLYVSVQAANGRVYRRKVLEHRYVMEQALGRRLHRHETVHHKHGVRHDNRLDQLELWSKSHPPGQRVEDKIAWAKEFLAQYGLEVRPASRRARSNDDTGQMQLW